MTTGTVKWFNAEKASVSFSKKTAQMFLFTFVTLTAQALNLLMKDRKYSLLSLKDKKARKQKK